MKLENGIYKKLYEMQFKKQEEAKETAGSIMSHIIIKNGLNLMCFLKQLKAATQ